MKLRPSYTHFLGILIVAWVPLQLASLERSPRSDTSRVDALQREPAANVFRLIQKLARVITGLRGAAALLDQGLVQEQGVIERTLDEIGEDIAFLAPLAITNDSITAP